MKDKTLNSANFAYVDEIKISDNVWNSLQYRHLIFERNRLKEQLKLNSRNFLCNNHDSKLHSFDKHLRELLSKNKKISGELLEKAPFGKRQQDPYLVLDPIVLVQSITVVDSHLPCPHLVEGRVIHPGRIMAGIRFDGDGIFGPIDAAPVKHLLNSTERSPLNESDSVAFQILFSHKDHRFDELPLGFSGEIPLGSIAVFLCYEFPAPECDSIIKWRAMPKVELPLGVDIDADHGYIWIDGIYFQRNNNDFSNWSSYLDSDVHWYPSEHGASYVSDSDFELHVWPEITGGMKVSEGERAVLCMGVSVMTHVYDGRVCSADCSLNPTTADVLNHCILSVVHSTNLAGDLDGLLPGIFYRMTPDS